MTELTLILALETGALLLAFALARLPLIPDRSATVARVLTALTRAGAAFFERARTRVALAAGSLSIAILLAGIGAGRTAVAAAAAAGALAGAGLALLSALVGGALSARASGEAVAAASARFDSTLVVSLRGGAAAGIAASACATLGAALVFALSYWLRDGGAAPAQAADLVRTAALALPGYALGAALTAAMLESGGGAYQGAARAGTAAASSSDASIGTNDVQNPALVSRVVGAHLAGAARSATCFAATAVTVAATLLLAAFLGRTTGEQVELAMLPLACKSFGLVACGTGVWVARPLESEGAGPALLRGLASSAALSLFGLAAAIVWLFPDRVAWLFAAGASGLVATGVLGHGLLAGFARRFGPQRETLDAARAGAGVMVATAAGAGLLYVAFAFLVAACAGLAARALGEASGLPHGAPLGLLLAATTPLSLLPYALGVEAAFDTAENARAIANMSGAGAEASRRLQRSSETSASGASVARAVLVATCCQAALAAGLVLWAFEAGASAESNVGFGGWVAIFGGVLTLLSAAAGVRRAAASAKTLCLEVLRQLESRVSESVTGPGEVRTPSYRACEEAASRAGIGAALPAAVLGVAGPVLLGILLWLVYRGAGPRSAAQALAMFVAGVAVTALGAALAVDGARAVLTGARRATRPEGDSASFRASVTGHALTDLLGDAAGPSARSVTLTAASVALLFIPLFL